MPLFAPLEQQLVSGREEDAESAVVTLIKGIQAAYTDAGTDREKLAKVNAELSAHTDALARGATYDKRGLRK